MALTQGDRDEIAQMIVDARREVQQCRAEYPHEGKLRYQRGPNVYVCECGQRYVKDGQGGLRDAQPLVLPSRMLRG